MMAAMLTQLPLPMMPGSAAEVAPGVGLVTGPDGGLVVAHGLATFAWDAGARQGGGPRVRPILPPKMYQPCRRHAGYRVSTSNSYLYCSQ
jgi:hypothetical protein